MPEGRQSPPPERQTGAQQGDPPASGKGIDKVDAKKDPKSQLDNLESNPKEIMEDTLRAKYPEHKF